MRELDRRALHPQGRNVLAFSGGPDSVCLLHLLIHHGLAGPLRVVHVDHGLDDDSASRARRAREIAASLGMHCHLERPERPEPAELGGPEAAARRARYACLARHLQSGEHLLTAHHADDQVETVLLRLLRGAGPRGLSGMRVKRRLAPGWLGRPLLGWPRTELRDWLVGHDLAWLQDPSNSDRRADRNYLRLEILPRLEARWPGCRDAVVAAAGWQREADAALEQRAASDLRRLRGRRESGHDTNHETSAGTTLDAVAWRALGPRRARAAFRRWCEDQGLVPPPDARLRAFLDQCGAVSPDRQPLLDWGPAEVRLWRGRIWLDARPLPPEHWSLTWDFAAPLAPPGGGRLEIHGAPLDGNVELGPVRDGERIVCRGQHRRIHELLRAAGIPPWRRRQVPVLRADGRVCAVGDLAVDDAFRARLSAAGAVLRWCRPAALLVSSGD